MRVDNADRRSVLRGLLLAAIARTGQAAPPLLEPASGPATQLAQGEAALKRGDAAAAMQAFEQAGAQGHDPAVELGLVRAAMQAGRYRQALGFAAHTAGEHPRDAACLAAYLWLLRLGGQDGFAQQLWSQASQLDWAQADRPLLAAARAPWSPHWPVATGALRSAPLRLAPYAHGEALPEGARVVASGTLVQNDQGVQRAIVSSTALSSLRSPGQGARWWVRNGLGLTVRATLEAFDPAEPLVALRLDQAMPGAATLAPRDAFPGSVAYALAFTTQTQDDAPATPSEGKGPGALAAWPWMRMGFAGQTEAILHPQGGPVCDAQGRLTGCGSIPCSRWRDKGWVTSAASANQSIQRLPPDEVYEMGLTFCLHVIVAP